MIEKNFLLPSNKSDYKISFSFTIIWVKIVTKHYWSFSNSNRKQRRILLWINFQYAKSTILLMDRTLNSSMWLHEIRSRKQHKIIIMKMNDPQVNHFRVLQSFPSSGIFSWLILGKPFITSSFRALFELSFPREKSVFSNDGYHWFRRLG